MNDEKEIIISKMTIAANKLAVSLQPDFIPESGAGIAYARTGARDSRDLASVKGGITKQTILTGSPIEIVFGEGGTVTRALLTAMKIDPRVRCIGVIRCTPWVVRMLDELFFEICSFDPDKEPPGISTMDWGVALCSRNGVPDAIYSSGTRDREAIVRFFGEEPEEVANSIIMVSARIIDAHKEE